MFKRGGIFSGFDGLGSLGAMGAENLLIALDPKAGTQPFVTMLQGVLQQQGASKVVADGKWGQCSHSAFKNTFGVEPSYSSLNDLFALQQFGVPAQNVTVWKPGITDVCWNGTDKYTAPPVAQQLSNPDPAFLLAKAFGLPLPSGLCTQGRVPNMTSQNCACPANTYEDPTTGNCTSMESPQTIPPNTTQQKAPPKISSTTVTTVTPTTTTPTLKIAAPGRGGSTGSYPCPADHPYYKGPGTMSAGCAPQLNAYPVAVNGKYDSVKGPFKCINGATAVMGTNAQGKQSMICPAGASTTASSSGSGGSMTPAFKTFRDLPGGTSITTPATSTGMGAGSKVLIGLAALAVLGGAGWLVLRKKPTAQAIANRKRRNRRRYRCNCGE